MLLQALLESMATVFQGIISSCYEEKNLPGKH